MVSGTGEVLLHEPKTQSDFLKQMHYYIRSTHTKKAAVS